MSSQTASLYRLYLANRKNGDNPLTAFVKAQIIKERAAKIIALRHSFSH